MKTQFLSNKRFNNNVRFSNSQIKFTYLRCLKEKKQAIVVELKIPLKSKGRKEKKGWKVENDNNKAIKFQMDIVSKL